MTKLPYHAPYPEAFKHNAIQLVLSGSKPKHQIAADLGIGLSTLDTWVRQHRRAHGNSPQASPTATPSSVPNAQHSLEQENRRLKREVEILRQEREILKAATKFFIKENP
jgi:transposase